jgi:hypothetical protein
MQVAVAERKLSEAHAAQTHASAADRQHACRLATVLSSIFPQTDKEPFLSAHALQPADSAKTQQDGASMPRLSCTRLAPGLEGMGGREHKEEACSSGMAGGAPIESDRGAKDVAGAMLKWLRQAHSNIAAAEAIFSSEEPADIIHQPVTHFSPKIPPPQPQETSPRHERRSPRYTDIPHLMLSLDKLQRHLRQLNLSPGAMRFNEYTSQSQHPSCAAPCADALPSLLPCTSAKSASQNISILQECKAPSTAEPSNRVVSSMLSMPSAALTVNGSLHTSAAATVADQGVHQFDRALALNSTLGHADRIWAQATCSRGAEEWKHASASQRLLESTTHREARSCVQWQARDLNDCRPSALGLDHLSSCQQTQSVAAVTDCKASKRPGHSSTGPSRSHKVELCLEQRSSTPTGSSSASGLKSCQSDSIISAEKHSLALSGPVEVAMGLCSSTEGDSGSSQTGEESRQGSGDMVEACDIVSLKHCLPGMLLQKEDARINSALRATRGSKCSWVTLASKGYETCPIHMQMLHEGLQQGSPSICAEAAGATPQSPQDPHVQGHCNHSASICRKDSRTGNAYRAADGPLVPHGTTAEEPSQEQHLLLGWGAGEADSHIDPRLSCGAKEAGVSASGRVMGGMMSPMSPGCTPPRYASYSASTQGENEFPRGHLNLQPMSVGNSAQHAVPSDPCLQQQPVISSLSIDSTSRRQYEYVTDSSTKGRINRALSSIEAPVEHESIRTDLEQQAPCCIADTYGHGMERTEIPQHRASSRCASRNDVQECQVEDAHSRLEPEPTGSIRCFAATCNSKHKDLADACIRHELRGMHLFDHTISPGLHCSAKKCDERGLPDVDCMGDCMQRQFQSASGCITSSHNKQTSVKAQEATAQVDGHLLQTSASGACSMSTTSDMNGSSERVRQVCASDGEPWLGEAGVLRAHSTSSRHVGEQANMIMSNSPTLEALTIDKLHDGVFGECTTDGCQEGFERGERRSERGDMLHDRLQVDASCGTFSSDTNGDFSGNGLCCSNLQDLTGQHNHAVRDAGSAANFDSQVEAGFAHPTRHLCTASALQEQKGALVGRSSALAVSSGGIPCTAALSRVGSRHSRQSFPNRLRSLCAKYSAFYGAIDTVACTNISGAPADCIASEQTHPLMEADSAADPPGRATSPILQTSNPSAPPLCGLREGRSNDWLGHKKALASQAMLDCLASPLLSDSPSPPSPGNLHGVVGAPAAGAQHPPEQSMNAMVAGMPSTSKHEERAAIDNLLAGPGAKPAPDAAPDVSVSLLQSGPPASHVLRVGMASWSDTCDAPSALSKAASTALEMPTLVHTSHQSLSTSAQGPTDAAADKLCATSSAMACVWPQSRDDVGQCNDILLAGECARHEHVSPLHQTESVLLPDVAMQHHACTGSASDEQKIAAPASNAPEAAGLPLPQAAIACTSALPCATTPSPPSQHSPTCPHDIQSSQLVPHSPPAPPARFPNRLASTNALRRRSCCSLSSFTLDTTSSALHEPTSQAELISTADSRAAIPQGRGNVDFGVHGVGSQAESERTCLSSGPSKCRERPQADGDARAHSMRAQAAPLCQESRAISGATKTSMHGICCSTPQLVTSVSGRVVDAHGLPGIDDQMHRRFSNDGNCIMEMENSVRRACPANQESMCSLHAQDGVGSRRCQMIEKRVCGDVVDGSVGSLESFACENLGAVCADIAAEQLSQKSVLASQRALASHEEQDVHSVLEHLGFLQDQVENLHGVNTGQFDAVAAIKHGDNVQCARQFREGQSRSVYGLHACGSHDFQGLAERKQLQSRQRRMSLGALAEMPLEMFAEQ